MYGQFTTLQSGLDAGTAPSLIGVDQFAGAVNMTIRGDYIMTRPPWMNHVVTDNTGGRFTGKYQGTAWYDGGDGQSCDIIARGGKLFRLVLGMTNSLTEITPRLNIVTTADFTVPAPAATVTVFVTSETPIATGDTVFIDSGQYLVVNRATDQLTLQYVAGAANAVAIMGNAVLDSGSNQIIEWLTSLASDDLIYMFQAETYMIILRGQHKTVFFDGSQAREAGPGELPPGILGAYGWGRVWISLNDQHSMVAGDLVNGPSGTPSLNNRDAVLKFTENDFLNEGGSFVVPSNGGPITAMQFLATPDTSLGLGVLLVGTTNAVYSINAPVDRTVWKNLQYPIQTISLLDYGPQGPRSTIPVNGDMWYRSQDGWRSFISAHRYYNAGPGNTPISHEISPLLDFDTESLLFYGSTILFDNRILQSLSPHRSDVGISHRGLTVLNLDLISGLQGKQNPAFEGAWTGLDIFQVFKATVNDVERGFAWVNNNGTFEFWEFLTEGYYDQYTTVGGGHTTITRTAIESWFETRSDDFGQPFERKKLRMFELYVDDVVDSVTIQLKFKPDQFPSWQNWGPPITICANLSQCNPPADCAVIQMRNPGYKARITWPQPPETCALTGTPINYAFDFQERIEVTGHCRFRRGRSHSMMDPTPMDGHTVCETQECVTLTGCQTDYFTYSVTGT